MKKLHLLILLVIVPAIAAGLAVLTFAWWALQPVSAQTQDTQKFTVAPGTPVLVIGRNLEEKGLVRSALAFRFVVWQQNLQNKIQAGSFELSPSSSPSEIALGLTQGTEDVWVTIREGLRAAEIGEQLDEQLENFDSKSPEFTEICLENEGFLFPETYLVPREFTTRSMCNFLQAQFDLVMTPEWEAAIEESGYTERQIVTLASIIEREARDAQDMKMVSGILHNRLDVGMPLQVDATLQYIKGYDATRKTWWTPPLAADKELNSAYNTYKNAGLPPGPISNPGKNALEAAIFPTENEYFYYISNSDGSNMHYAVTYDEHLRNIDLYLR
jgi:UPF0755 protein